jgi:hypothetical protein
MSEPIVLNPNAVDAAIASAGRPVDVVQVPASELVALRQAAGSYGQLEQSTAAFVASTALEAALANRPDLVEGAGAKVAALVSGDLVASMVDGKWTVASKGGQGVAEHLRNYLADPRNSMFLKANHRGGAGADGTQPAASGRDPIGSREATPVQRAAANMQAARNAFGGRGIGGTPRP